jgi:hypothetical protein
MYSLEGNSFIKYIMKKTQIKSYSVIIISFLIIMFLSSLYILTFKIIKDISIFYYISMLFGIFVMINLSHYSNIVYYQEQEEKNKIIREILK